MPFECQLCPDHQFRLKDLLYKHIKKVHDGSNSENNPKFRQVLMKNLQFSRNFEMNPKTLILHTDCKILCSTQLELDP